MLVEIDDRLFNRTKIDQIFERFTEITIKSHYLFFEIYNKITSNLTQDQIKNNEQHNVLKQFEWRFSVHHGCVDVIVRTHGLSTASPMLRYLSRTDDWIKDEYENHFLIIKNILSPIRSVNHVACCEIKMACNGDVVRDLKRLEFNTHSKKKRILADFHYKFCCAECEKDIFDYYSKFIKILEQYKLPLKSNIRFRRNVSLKTRILVLKRDKFRCKYCGVHPHDGVTLEVDHIRPISKGGSNEMDNLQTLCRLCNAGKSDLWDPSFIKGQGKIN